MAEHGGNHLHFVLEAMREQRTNGPIDQAGNQGFLLGRAPFALEKPTGDLARGKGFFLVIHGQREEILPRLRRFRAHRRAQHDGIAIADHHRTIGLTGDLAGFQNELTAAPVEFLAEIIKHAKSSLFARRRTNGEEDGRQRYRRLGL